MVSPADQINIFSKQKKMEKKNKALQAELDEYRRKSKVQSEANGVVNVTVSDGAESKPCEQCDVYRRELQGLRMQMGRLKKKVVDGNET